MKLGVVALGLLAVCGGVLGKPMVWQPAAGHAQMPIWPGAAPDPQPVPGPETVTVSRGAVGRQVADQADQCDASDDDTKFMERDKPWSEQRMPLVKDRIRDRLGDLSTRLGDTDWLDGAFSAGDLMMASVLLRLKSSGMLEEYPNLVAYLAHGEARPAFKRAFEAQLAVFLDAEHRDGPP